MPRAPRQTTEPGHGAFVGRPHRGSPIRIVEDYHYGPRPRFSPTGETLTEMTPAQARVMAADLVEAADISEGLR
jgi:hypothetical protein